MVTLDRLNTTLTKNENVRLSKNLLFNKKKIERNKWLFEQHENLKKEMIMLLNSSKELEEFIYKIDKNKLNKKEISLINYNMTKLKLLKDDLSRSIDKNSITIPKILNFFLNINIIASIIFTIVFGYCGFHVILTNDISEIKSLVPEFALDNLGNKGVAFLFIIRSLINLFTIKLSFYIKKSLSFEYIKDKESRRYKELRLVVNDYKNTLNKIKNKLIKINNLSNF